jgi:mannose-6-phosphate isomerase-like protein (cupin superfamily)
MITLINLDGELAKLKMLRGRTPQTPAAERAGTAAQLADYRDGALFASKFSGKGAWERHANGDELVQIIDGEATLEIVEGDVPPQALEVRAGMVAIVPQGAWHRFQSPNGVTLMTATPRPSEHIRDDVDDPRTGAVERD